MKRFRGIKMWNCKSCGKFTNKGEYCEICWAFKNCKLNRQGGK